MTTQYPRKVGLVVTAGSKGLDLSKMRITFRIMAADAEAPNTAVIRIYNLADNTAKSIQNEFTDVTLQAGYENGPYAVIFQGTIKQVKRGRESAIDSYVELLAADGDVAYNFAVVNTSLKAGSSPQDRAKAIAKSMEPHGVKLGDLDQLSATSTGGILPRGKVLFGLAREHLSDLAASQSVSWSIQNGVLTFIPLTGYLPGEAVQLNSRTGLIGIPEATDGGIRVRCLINPLIKIGTRIQINNADINTTTIRSQGFPRYSDINFVADTSADGFYRALVIEHKGDSRGQDWYSDLICLAVDESAPVNQAVKAYG